MNVQEMVTKLRIAMGDDIEPYAVPTSTIFQWLSDAYLRIQVEFDQWKFFHKRKMVFATVAGKAEYYLHNVKEISKESLYCKRAGENARFPMYFLDYDLWVADEQLNLQRQGDPRYFISLPNGSYRIEPVPTETWQIWGDVWYKPAGFENLTDEPIWAEEYHSLVVWEALKIAALEFVDSKKAPRMQANLTVNLPPMRRAFNYEYLNPKGCAGPLL